VPLAHMGDLHLPPTARQTSAVVRAGQSVALAPDS
jgi:hypothetical protein